GFARFGFAAAEQGRTVRAGIRLHAQALARGVEERSLLQPEPVLGDREHRLFLSAPGQAPVGAGLGRAAAGGRRDPVGQRRSGGMTGKPLVVDLDGTLLRSDMLLESACAYVKANPHRFYRPFLWLMRGGKAGLKARLAREVGLEIDSLPFDAVV